MPEWLIESGIGETRAALVEVDRILEARIELAGTIPAGTIAHARLLDCGTGGRNGTARDDSGTDYLLPHVPKEITEGASFNIEVTRPTLPGPEPWKRPLAKATRDERRRPHSLAERLRSTGHSVMGALMRLGVREDNRQRSRRHSVNALRFGQRARFARDELLLEFVRQPGHR